MNDVRLIDADTLRQDWLENGQNEYVYDTNAVLYSIDAQPTIDAVPVVRCKDCTYRVEYFDSGKYVCTRWQCMCCGRADYVKPDDFCSYGKRKDGDTNG